jgi:hypothetical protein
MFPPARPLKAARPRMAKNAWPRGSRVCPAIDQVRGAKAASMIEPITGAPLEPRGG